MSLVKRVLGGAPHALWLGVRATDAEPFFPYFGRIDTVSLDYGVEISKWIETGTTVITAEQQEGHREQWYSEQLDRLLAMDGLRKGHCSESKDEYLIPFAVTERIQKFCQQHRYVLVAADPKIKTELEDKIRLLDVVHSLGLPALPSIIVSKPNADYAQAGRDLNSRILVVQRRNSASGSGTFLVRDHLEWVTALERVGPNELIKISSYVSGPIASLSCVVTDDVPVLGPITRQVVSIPELAPAWGVYSGNVFYDFEWANNAADIRAMGYEICRHVARRGFRGLFNLNFLVEGAYLIDINPRCMGHFRILSDIQQCDGTIPFAGLHILSTLGHSFQLSGDCYARSNVLQNASLIVMHSLEQTHVKVGANFKVGVYEFSRGGIQFLRPGNSLADLVSESEFLILDPLPLKGTVIAPGAALCRIHKRESILDADNERLTEFGRDLVQCVYSSLSMELVSH